MKFEFIGIYTGKNNTINVGGAPEVGGVTFVGREPANVENEELIARLKNNREFAVVGSKAPKADKEAVAEVEADDMKALRFEYEVKVGRKPFGGWDADKLREKIAEVSEA